ncbi:HAD family hydrolase [Massilia sp. W12]|uniref:HAD family hydrolase n=1 Tax=Massilia sp. W12 TaxID=3126507 RepID=UPI0030D237EC
MQEQEKTGRRRALRTLIAGSAVAASGAALAHEHQHGNAEHKTPALLARGKWAPRNWAALNTLLREHGKHSKKYNPKRKPYAVFDWDNTSIMNDCEEALLYYQIMTLSFKLKPQEFATVIRQHVPAGPFTADYKNAAGKIVELDEICADLAEDYNFLYAEYAGLGGKKTLEEVSQTPQFADFRAKLLFLYNAVNDTHGVNVGYPWVIYFFANMSVPEVMKLAEASHDFALGEGLSKVKYSSPASLPGKAGVISISHFHGIRLCTEVADLMDALRNHGIDVYVSTASMEEVVAAFATLPKYGYHVARENVLGLRLARKGDVLQNAYMPEWPLNWGPGKTEVIKRELLAKKGYGPLFVAGDSDGDYDMLRDFSDTALGLVVNRLKKGKIGELCKQAVDAMNSPKPRFILQGRQESTGNWLPHEMCLKLGKSQPALLP